MKAWKNITLDLPNMDLNLVSDILSILDILSFTILDKQNESDSNWFDDPKHKISITGNTHNLVLLLHANQDIHQLMLDIKSLLKLTTLPAYHEEIFEDKDWVTFTQSQFKEIRISDSLRIIPTWESETSFSGKSIIIQPGSGFGTGSHPTTQLCLKWLEKNLNGHESMLDYGCGSGILSIGAELIGTSYVEGVELDPLALQNANHNNEINGLAIPFYHPNSFSPKESYTIIVANILAVILIRLAPKIGPLIGEILVLSGILEEQVEDVIQCYSKWINLSSTDKKDGWVLLSNSQ